MNLLLKNGCILLNGRLEKKDIAVEEGKIASIGFEGGFQGRVVDCSGKIVMPGVIDSHVHFRVPGMEHKEDWKTGSAAALAGGVTTVIEMPNTRPPTATVGALEKKKSVAEKDSRVRAEFHFAATNDNSSELERVEGVASFKVFMGSGSGELLIEKDSVLERVFRIARKRKIPVTVHAEEERTIRENTEEAKRMRWNGAAVHSMIKSAECEEEAVRRALDLQEIVGNKLHFLHISSSEALKQIGEAKKYVKGVSCEVTPHHLFLDVGAYEKIHNYAKVNPPLRERRDVLALWNGIEAGVVDSLGSDHAPHPREEKERGYWAAAAGMPGIETMLPLMLNAVNKERVSLPRLQELCCEAPARIFSLKGRGMISEGWDADLTVVDLEREWVVEGERLYTKCKWSPFEGWRLKGMVEKTIVGGEIRFENTLE